MYSISMADANDFVQQVMLDGVAYKLHFAYNSYSAQWTVDVRDSKNVDIIRAVAIVPNFPLLAQHRRVAALPNGELMAVVVNPAGSDNQRIDRNGFVDGRFSLVYVPEDELNALV